ncbi:MAG: DUF3575 domain-containing protein [Mucinivorans sp.]
MKRWLVVLLISAFLIPRLMAGEQKYTAKVFFQTGYGELDRAYSGNGLRLDSLITELCRLISNQDFEISRIEFAASASPTGSITINKKLVAARLSAIEQYVCHRVNLPADKINKINLGVGYDELRRLVAASTMPYREQVLDIIDYVPEFIYNERHEWVDGCKKRLMDLSGGRAWHYMVDHIFPKMQSASVDVSVYLTPVDRASIAPIAVPSVRPFVRVPRLARTCFVPNIEPFVSVAPRVQRPLFALKTNMLYDLASALNLGLEIPIGSHWSIGAEVIFPWWKNNKANMTIQLLTGTVEGRYWFGNRAGRDVLTGWNMGLYVGGGLFDFQLFDPHGIQGEFFIAAGVSGGFAHSIGRRLRLEYSVAFGYVQTNYREYDMTRGTGFGDIKVWRYPWQTNRNRWFGPTKLSVSLVWMLNYNTNKVKRGGVR